MGGNVEQQIAELRKRQHGVASVAQAVRLGVGRSTVYEWVARGRYRFVCDGVITDAGTVLGPLGLLQAHILSGGEHVVASSRSALALHGFGTHPDAPDLVTFHGRRVRIDGVWVPRRRLLTTADLTWRQGMRCLQVEWALVEAAQLLRRDQIEDAVDRVLAERRTTLERLRTVAARLRRPRVCGPSVILDTVAARDSSAPTESTLEDRWRRVVRSLGLQWSMQVVLRDADGERIVRADFTCVEHPDLVVECDSYRWHSGQRAFDRDTRRRTRLAAEGRAPLVFTWRDITRDAPYVRRMISRRVVQLAGTLT